MLPASLSAAEATARPRVAGTYFATYYNLADEHYFPPGDSVARNSAGAFVTKASTEFLREVMRQGSGVTRQGLRLRYEGRGFLFRAYRSDIWGLAAGHNYLVYPYRTIALHFADFCRALGLPGPCRKSTVIGALVRIEEVARMRIVMPGGGVHDGYFCAADTGAPNYIREDRIDIFVGLHGGGNPYLPPYRRGNHLIEGGIENLVPADWRLWRNESERVWCPRDRIPPPGAAPRAGDCRHDYRTVARHKGLSLTAFFDNRGRLIRCRSGQL